MKGSESRQLDRMKTVPISEVRSLLSAIAFGTSHFPSHMISSCMSDVLQQRNPKLFAEQLRETCAKLLAQPELIRTLRRKSFALAGAELPKMCISPRANSDLRSHRLDMHLGKFSTIFAALVVAELNTITGSTLRNGGRSWE